MSESPAVEHLPELIEAAAAVVGEVDLDTVLRRLVSEARQATGARYAALGVLGEYGVLVDFIHEGLSEAEAKRIGKLPTGRGVLGTVIREKRTIRVEDISSHPDAHGFPPNHPPMGSFLGVPVAAGSAAFGNLYLTEKAGGFTDQDVTLVEALSRIAGAAVHTARLQDRLRRVAVVEDRERIARDLHDSVIQDLFAVGLGLQSVSQRVVEESVGAVIDDAVDRLDNAVESLRSYIFELKEGATARLSLDEQLQEVVSRMGSAYPAAVSLEVEVDDSIPAAIESEILNIATEALSNALRHSDAGSVMVQVQVRDGGWSLSVTDDGSGFDPAESTSGMGIRNMRSRAGGVGASFKMTTEIGGGTRLEVDRPVS